MSGQGREIELKFLCAPADLGAVLAAAPAGDDECRELISVCFDTVDGDLQKAGVSLRVRESNGRRVQTLKRGQGMSREEHEADIESLAPDPSLGPLPDLLPQMGPDVLKPAFHVRITRRQRLIRLGRTSIELAIDLGEVQGGAGQAPISEVELELKSGPPAALFEMARELSQAAPLYLSFDGKSSQGQALVAGSRPQARRKERVSLSPDATAAEAFQAVARGALAHIAGNAQILREGPQEDAVHQLRVAARRLRSTLSTFAEVIRGERADWVRGELRWLARACDDARNLDVFRAEILRPAREMDTQPRGFEALCAAVEAARRRAARKVARAASSQRFRALLLETAAWVETGGWLEDPGLRKPRQALATAFAAEALDRRLKKLGRRGRKLAETDDAARHEARIEAKKLRYAAEAFSSLYPQKAAERFIDRLKGLQDELGVLNDVATAEPLVAGLKLDADAAFAAGELVGLKAAETPRHLGRAARALERLRETEPFWRR
ncbi:CHAD domain-containing protein [Phenylobacterium sp.]|uniref:CYTH and CHAD domain-containing protein n=1 Tax=Phenylobacterium sp. TaxID=1871053 RepID=UPI003983C192